MRAEGRGRPMLMREEDIPRSWVGTLVAISCFLAYAVLGLLAISIVWRAAAAADSPEVSKPLVDFSQVLNNFATVLLLFVAIFAFYAARGQLKEAEKVRKVQVYMKIIDMWNAPEMVASRHALTSFVRNWDVHHLQPLCRADDFINDILHQMLASERAGLQQRYGEVTKILELLEYIGSLCRRGELDTDYIFDFMGSAVQQITEDFLLSHIVTIRRRFGSGSNYANVLYLMEQARAAEQATGNKFRIGGYGVR